MEVTKYSTRYGLDSNPAEVDGDARLVLVADVVVADAVVKAPVGGPTRLPVATVMA